MAMPRLLPIVFVAVGGVLALKAMTSLEIMPDLFHQAQALAADTAKPAPKKAVAKKASGEEASKADDPSDAFPVTADDATSRASDAATTAPVPAPVCATSINQLAQDAGMSPNELQLLQSLGQRRAQLDQREQGLDAREQLINAADSKLDNRISQLQDLKNQVQGLLDQANKAQDADTNRLVAVYAAMKPKDAAAVFATMDDDVRLPIAALMKDRALAAIMGAMPPVAARELTEKLARRMSQAGGLQQQLNKATANGAPGAAPAPASASAAPAQPGAKPAAKKG